MNAAVISPGLVRAGVELMGSTGAEQAIATVLGGLTAIDGQRAVSQADERLHVRPDPSRPDAGGRELQAHHRPGQDLE